jgi:hypothetical protein
MPRKGPADIYQPGQVGKAVQANFQFLHALFDANHQAFRDKLVNCADETAARKMLGDNGLTVPPPIRIMVVDIENARTKFWGKPIDPGTEEWYVLVMPPVPRRKQNADYVDMQAWSAAWYHASNDGYGM